MHDVLQQWGENIRVHREARGWTQAQLAEQLGLTRAAISYWESGSRTIKDEHKLAVAQLFKTSVRTLFPLLTAPTKVA